MSAVGFAARPLFARAAAMPAAAGSAVMALGIFGLAALQQMPSLRAAATQPLAIGSLVLWAILAASYGAAALKGTLWSRVGRPVGTFAIGCWVAATAVLLELIVLAVPEWRPLALALGTVAVAIWIWFLRIMAEDAGAAVRAGARAPVPGAVLLATVSTQSLALAALALFPDGPRPFSIFAAEAVVALGGALYVAGAALVVWSHVRAPGWTLAGDWDNSNCILHGAMSITGLAVVSWRIGPPALAVALWLYVLAVFVVVEAIEIARLAARVGACGWRRGAFSYRVSQWSRNFTFGMFYAFTLALSQWGDLPPQWSWVAALQRPVLTFGPYLVLAFLLIEIGLFLGSRLGRGPASGART
jgi:hypothetical protein